MRPKARITAAVALIISGMFTLHAALARRAMRSPWTVPPDRGALPVPNLETFDSAGVRVYFVKAPVPLFQARLFLPFPPDMPAVAKLVQSGLFQIEGTETCPGDAWPLCLDRAGATLEVEVDPDFLTLTISTDADQAPVALKLLGDLMVHPRNTTQGLSLVKSTLREWTARRLDDPVAVATDRLFRQFFGDHPYASQIAYATIADLSFEETVAWRQRMTCPSDAWLVVTSPFDQRSLQPWVAAGFAGWQSCSRGEPGASPPPTLATSETSAGIRLEAVLPGSRSAMAIGRTLDPTDCEQVGVARVVARLVSQRVGAAAHAGAGFGAQATTYARGGVWWAWLSAPRSDDARVLWDTVTQLRNGDVKKRAVNQAIRAEIAATLEQGNDFPALVGLEARARAGGASCLATPNSYLTWLQHLSPSQLTVLARRFLDLDALVVVTCGPSVGDPSDTGPGEAGASPLPVDSTLRTP